MTHALTLFQTFKDFPFSKTNIYIFCGAAIIGVVVIIRWWRHKKPHKVVFKEPEYIIEDQPILRNSENVGPTLLDVSKEGIRKYRCEKYIFEDMTDEKKFKSMLWKLQESPSITTLYLNSCQLRDTEAQALATTMTGRSLSELQCNSNNIGDKGIIAIIDALLQNPQVELHTFSFAQNQISEQGAVSIAKLLDKVCYHVPSLTWLATLEISVSSWKLCCR